METKNTRHPERSRWIPWTSRKLAWFTLVELIVVITILVILGTIAFLNLGNFSSGARDSWRVSDLTNISKGLDLLYVKNGVVLPPESGTNAGVVNLYASWVLIGQQWAIGTTVLSAIKMGGDGKDPVDKKSYTYLVNADKTKYQLLALAEDSSSVIGLNATDRAYAGYESRYPMTKGSSLGVLLGNTGATLNQPIQENYSASTFTGIELFTATGGLYQAVLSSKSILSGTGNALLPMVASLDTSAGYYPGCDTPNIRLPNGQIWAACNVGASTSIGYDTVPDQWAASATIPINRIANIQWNLYQWGRNDNVTSGTWTTSQWGGTLTPPNNTSGDTNFYQGDGVYGSWYTPWINNSNPAWGWNIANGGDNRGPCATGYHVPSDGTSWSNTEWRLAAQIITGTDAPSGSQLNDTMRTILRLPLVGYRHSSSGLYYFQWVRGLYWSSSFSGTSSYFARFDKTGGSSWIALSNDRALAYPIRCIKN